MQGAIGNLGNYQGLNYVRTIEQLCFDRQGVTIYVISQHGYCTIIITCYITDQWGRVQHKIKET